MKMKEYTNFSEYIEKLEFFFTGIEDSPENSGRRKAILLSILVSKTILKIYWPPNILTDKRYSEIVEVLKNHFQPKPSELVKWYKFYTYSRKTLW